MLRLFGDHSYSSALGRMCYLLREVGPAKTFSILLAVLDDQYIKSFDRKYKVRTSGYVPLASTSFNRSRLVDATQYRPVYAWGLRKLLKDLDLPRRLSFADLGCGLGRACFIAAEYGFERVTGVELAPELCAVARKNVESWQSKAGRKSQIVILEMDALDYCDTTEDDLFFMFRPFSEDFLRRIIRKLSNRARVQKKPLTIVYSERIMLPGSYKEVFKEDDTFRKKLETANFGQAFYVYECG